MRIAVIYKSKTGNAKKFAEMIAKELNADLFSSNMIHVERLFNYDTIIFGGGLYVRGVYGLRNIVNNLDMLQGKNIIVFATGATTPSKDHVNQVLRTNFTEKQLQHMKVFYLHTGLDHSRLSLYDKLAIKFMKRKLEKKASRTEEEESLLRAYRNTIEFNNAEAVQPLVDYVKEL